MVATLEKTLSHTAFNTTDKGLDLFFYDFNLEGRDNLIPYISENSKLVPITNSDNFLTKLSQFSSKKINNLYILCHGEAGKLKIGSEVVNKNSLLEFSKSNTLDIEIITLLSCNVGQDINFIKTLSEVFSCVVNYSDKLVGHKSLGGSWDLSTFTNNQVGSNKVVTFTSNSLPFSREAINNWEHTLPITVSANQIADLISNPSSISGYSATDSIIIDGPITHTVAGQLNAVNATSITATIIETTAANLSAIAVNNSTRTSLNAFTFTVSDTTATAATLNAVKAITSVAPNFGKITGITASPASDIVSLYTPVDANGVSTNTTLANETISVNDTTISAATLITINGYTAGVVTATATTITGTAANLETVLTADGGGTLVLNQNVAGNQALVNVTTTDTTVGAAAITTLNNNTDGTVNASSVTTLTGHDDVVAAVMGENNTKTEVINNVTVTKVNTIDGLDAVNITLDNPATNGPDTYTAQAVRGITLLTSGIVTATLSQTAIAQLLHAQTGLTENGHNLTITSLADNSIAGEDLVNLAAKTTVPIPVAAATVTGTYANIVAAYALSGSGLTGLGNEAITPTAPVTVAEANALNALTTGVVTATISDGDMATLAGLTLNTDANGVQVVDGNNAAVENAYTIVPTDTTVAASALFTLNSKTSTAVNATNVATVTGTLGEISTVYAAAGIVAGIDNLGNEAITISDTGSLNADLFQGVNSRTTGIVTVSGAVTNLTGEVANVAALFAGNGNAEGVVFTANPTVTITDTSCASATLITVDAATTGLVTVNSGTITGTETDLNTVLTAGTAANNFTPTLAGIGDKNITVDANDGVNITALSTLTSRTTGTVTATISGGNSGNITTVLAASDAIGTGNALSFTITTSTAAADSVDAADLIALNALTTAPITVTLAGALTGTAANLRTVFDANTAKDNNGAAPAGSQISGLELEPVTITGTTHLAEDLLYIDGKTTGVVAYTATNISGTAEDIADVYTADTAANNFTPTLNGAAAASVLTVTDSVVAAGGVKGLNAINALSEAVVTTTATTITGAHGDVYLSLLANNSQKLDNNNAVANAAATELISGLDSVDVVLTAAETSAEVNLLDNLTTGTITGTVSDGAISALLHSQTGVQNLDGVHNLTITVTDTTVAASDLATLNSKTSVVVTAAAATILTGTSTQLLAAYAANTAGTIAGLGNEALTITGGISVADFNTLAADTQGTITATITDTDATTLKTISESGHNLSITIGDASVAAADISAIDALTASLVTVGSATITGTDPEIDAAYALRTAGTSTWANPALTLTSPITVAEATTMAGLTSGIVTATISANSMTGNGALTGIPNENNNAFTITITDASVDAGPLATLNSRTTVPITLTSTTITGQASEIVTALIENTDLDANGAAAPRTYIGLDAVNATVDDGTATIAEVNDITSRTTGTLTATVTAGGVNQGLDHLVDTTTGILESGHALSITVDDDGGNANISAASLNTLNGLTTGLITVSGNVTRIDGTVADLKTAFAANPALDANGAVVAGAQITGLQVVPALITYPQGADTSLAAADLNILDAATTGTITATNATSLTGVGAMTGAANARVSEVRTALTAIGTNQITWGGAIPVTLTGNTTVADALLIMDGTTGAVTATISDGDMTALNTLDEDAHVLTITVTDTTADAGNLNTLNGRTTLPVNLSALTSISGDHAELTTLFAANAAGTVTGLGNEALTISGDANGNALTVTEANTADGWTTGAVTATIETGAIAALAALGGTGNVFATSINDATLDADALATLMTKTTGVLTITGGTLSGSASSIAAAYAANTAGTVTGLGNEAVTITSTGAILAADINSINAGTSGVVTANNVTTLSGTASAVNAAYAANTAGTIAGLGNEAVTITDSSVTASALATANANTTGVVTVNSTAVTGSVTELTALYAANGAGTITGLGNEALTVTDTSITSVEANTIAALSTGVVTATVSTGDVDTLLGITESGNALAMTITDATVSAANLNTLDAKTTGSINVTSTAITGLASAINTAYASSGFTGLGSESITTTDTTVSAAALNTLNTNTTGNVDASSVTTLTGSVDELYVALSHAGMTGLAGKALTITNSGNTVAAVNQLDGATTGTIDGSALTLLTGTAADLTTALDSAGITGLGNETMTLSDVALTATALNTLDVKTTGAINAGTVTSLSGTVAAVNTAYSSAGVTGLGNESVAITDTSISATALNTLDGNTTGSIDASTLKTITGTGADAQTAFNSTGINLTFDASDYLAGHTDLLGAYGTDTTLASAHYFAFGVAEGRSFDAFDESSYLASHADLLAAFGTNTSSALAHYLNFGYSEGRSTDSFDEFSYIASNADVLALYGIDDGAAATAHYVTTGYAAGKSVDSFDDLGYIASYADLIGAFGTDSTAATKHYIAYGSTEGRTVTFDAASYLGAHADLSAAFGTNQELAKQHYIVFGAAENRALS